MAPCLDVSAASMRHASMAMSCVADEKPTSTAKTAIVPRLRVGSVPATSQSPSMISPWHTSIHERRCPSQPSSTGTLRAVDERRPEELEGRDERDQAEEADHFEREARGAQPGRQRVEDQEVGQAGRKPERHHDQRGPLGVHARAPSAPCAGQARMPVSAQAVRGCRAQESLPFGGTWCDATMRLTSRPGAANVARWVAVLTTRPASPTDWIALLDRHRCHAAHRDPELCARPRHEARNIGSRRTGNRDDARRRCPPGPHGKFVPASPGHGPAAPTCGSPFPAHEPQHHHLLHLGSRTLLAERGSRGAQPRGAVLRRGPVRADAHDLQVAIEASEAQAYRRLAKGMRNPRRIRDAQLRISFLTLSVVLSYPLWFVYVTLHLRFALLTEALIVPVGDPDVLACDPLPPCTGKVTEWLRGLAPARDASANLPTTRSDQFQARSPVAKNRRRHSGFVTSMRVGASGCSSRSRWTRSSRSSSAADRSWSNFRANRASDRTRNRRDRARRA